jgi:hypothetical protein
MHIHLLLRDKFISYLETISLQIFN